MRVEMTPEMGNMLVWLEDRLLGEVESAKRDYEMVLWTGVEGYVRAYIQSQARILEMINLIRARLSGGLGLSGGEYHALATEMSRFRDEPDHMVHLGALNSMNRRSQTAYDDEQRELKRLRELEHSMKATSNPPVSPDEQKKGMLRAVLDADEKAKQESRQLFEKIQREKREWAVQMRKERQDREKKLLADQQARERRLAGMSLADNCD